MEQVGIQKKLSFERAFKIAVQGIRIRLGRSLVTVSGVVLGIAFLMSNLTGQLIKQSVAAERELRQTVNLMQAMINAEVGDLTGKHIAVATYGQLTPPEKALLASLSSKCQLGSDPAGATLLAEARPDSPVGRKFDFLCQEFNREANTLCSKSADIELTRIGIDLKGAIERLREQVQNVE